MLRVLLNRNTIFVLTRSRENFRARSRKRSSFASCGAPLGSSQTCVCKRLVVCAFSESTSTDGAREPLLPLHDASAAMSSDAPMVNKLQVRRARSTRPPWRAPRLVNKLQETCALAGDVAGDTIASAHRQNLPSVWETLPQIVVVGGQSSGKSRARVHRRSRLPAARCGNMHAPAARPSAALRSPTPATPRASCIKPKRSSRLSRGCARGDRGGDEPTGRAVGSKAVSSEPIMLSIRSPNVPNLTLVDMPGLTKVATADQPVSIVRDIEEWPKFIVSENVVIVAVSRPTPTSRRATACVSRRRSTRAPSARSACSPNSTSWTKGRTRRTS